MWLLVGLGNPGEKYRNTRHNLGFMLIDRIAAKAGIKVTKPVCQSLAGVGKWLNQEIVLAKPQTFMNLSGEAVKGLVTKYKIDSGNILVAHDDLDLPLERIKIVSGGGSGGHKGVNSITNCIGRSDFPRLKLGIGRPPNQYMDPAAYVLEPFNAREMDLIDQMLEKAVLAVESVLLDGLKKAQNVFNRVIPSDD
jgi:PTH1 family peptidyl-tRNA hydrolase